ncbi:imelysin family protein [Rhodobacteraceae bacterium KMM 6894]|nr:imelysin family protein [Rhodobacteraceae bacterium KMM 6894]
MKLLSALAVTLGLATPSFADVDAALDQHILPGFAGFAAATGDLAQTAAQDCRAQALRPAFQSAFDAWMQVGDLRIGPSETGALSIAFWPDSRGFTQRTLKNLLADEDPVANTPEAYSDVSIAARGLFALEMLIFDPAFADYDANSYACTLATTIAQDLNNQADALDTAWTGNFATTLRTAGSPGNATYLTKDEAVRALYTQILTSLEFTENQRLGSPMGTFDRPRPARAEARRSKRSLRNVVLATEAAHELAATLADFPLPQTDDALEHIHKMANRIEDPAFQDVTDPQARLHVEVLQQAVHNLRSAVETEIGVRLGISPGFNSQDGD